MTAENDLVLIYLEDSPVSFARVESIEPDVKKDWYHIELLMLQVPLQTVTWILKNDYINGDEFFMNGKAMRLEKVEKPTDQVTASQDNQPDNQQGNQKDNQETDQEKSEDAAPKTDPDESETSQKAGKVVSLADFKKAP